MKILITGSKYRPAVDVKNVLDRYDGEVSEIVVGDSTGADEAARAWASDHGVKCVVFKSDSARDHFFDFSRRAIEERPLLCLAFPIPGSRGTFTCIRKARELNIPVTIIPGFDNEPATRPNTDDYVSAVPTDASLMRATLKRTLNGYAQGIRELESR